MNEEGEPLPPEAPAPPAPSPAEPSPTTSGSSTGLTIVRNSLWMMIDSAQAIVVSFYCSITVARKLGPDLMGQFNYVLYFATVLKLLADMAVSSTVRKFMAEFAGRKDYNTIRTLVRAAMRLQFGLASTAVTIGLVLVTTLFSPEQRVIGAIAVVSILPQILLGTPSGALLATENVRHVVFSSLISGAANLIGVTVTLIMGWGLVGLTTSLLLSRVVDAATRFILFRRVYAGMPGKVDPAGLDPAVRQRMMRFATHQMLQVLLYSLLFDRVEVLFLKSLATPRDIAYFSISFTLVSYLLHVPMNLAGSTQVSVWVQQGRSPAEATRTTATATWFVMVLAAPTLFGVAAISEPLLRVLYGTKYVDAAPVLTALAVLSLGLAVSQPTQFLLIGAERQRFYVAWMAVAGLVGVGADLLLIPHLGALGAAIAKGIAGFTGAAGFLIYLVRVFGGQLPLRRMGLLLLTTGVMFVGVRLVVRWLPPLGGILVGIPLGAAIFLLLTRLLRYLDSADGARLRQLERAVPARARRSYLRIVDFLVAG